MTACTTDSGNDPSATATAVATSTSSPPSPSETPSPSPTVTPEEELLAQIPENAREQDFASATNFARFFLTEWDRSYVTLDTALLNALSLDSCTFCASTTTEISEFRSAGLAVDGGGVEFSNELPRGGLEENGDTNVTLRVTVGALTATDSEGNVETSYSSEDLMVAVVLRYQDAHWAVVDVASEPA